MKEKADVFEKTGEGQQCQKCVSIPYPRWLGGVMSDEPPETRKERRNLSIGVGR